MRKSHTKSRKGCLQCKKRHTKCNEAKPSCGNCMRLEIACSFLQKSPQASNSPPTTSQASSHHAGEVNGDSLHLQQSLALADLELLHNYLRGPHFSFAQGIRDEIVRDRYVQTGLEFPYVLHSLLGVSALDIAVHEPGRRAEMMTLGSNHWNASLRLATPHIANMQKAHALPLFVLSGMTAIYSNAEGLLKATANSTLGKDAFDHLLDGLRIARGTSVIIEPHKELLRNSWAAPMFRIPRWEEAVKMEGRLDGKFPYFPELRHLIHKHCSSEEEQNQFLEATNRILAPLAMNMDKEVDSDGSHFLVSMWQATVPDTLLSMIESRQPVALILLAYYAALMGSAPKLWWLYRWPDVLLPVLKSQLDPQYAHHIQWVERHCLTKG